MWGLFQDVNPRVEAPDVKKLRISHLQRDLNMMSIFCREAKIASRFDLDENFLATGCKA
ncbi:hypothetical protein CHELA41_50694 [Hyphomicrobiales bacterium]|nr:hypothetical protein CHELA41_50694 [Hyphomicrobiales bacterium]